MHALFEVPAKDAKAWDTIELPNFIWDGNPDGRVAAKMWVTGWWKTKCASRSIQFGCLHCGYRTPLIYLNHSSTANEKSGKERIAEVVRVLFRD
jgi:hypothetical protein